MLFSLLSRPRIHTALEAAARQSRPDLSAVSGHGDTLASRRPDRKGAGEDTVPRFKHPAPLLKRLEAAGLITRTRNHIDEREVLIHLTEKGGALRARAADIMRCIDEAVGVDAEALRAIKQSLDTIRDKIKT